MKKLPVYLIIVLLYFSGCTNLNRIKSETCRVIDRSGTIIDEWFYLYDKNGREINVKRSGIKDDYYWNRSTEYNPDGTIKKITDYGNDGSIERTSKFEYISGRCVKELNYDKKSILMRYSISDFPSAFTEVMMDFNSDHKLISKTRDELDTDGKILKRIFYDSKGKIKGRHSFTYAGNPPKRIMSGWISENDNCRIIYKYDAHGKEISRIEYRNGKIEKNWGYSYSYNTAGEIITETFYDNGKKTGTKYYKYRYDNAGLLDSFILYNSENEIIERGEFKYKFY